MSPFQGSAFTTGCFGNSESMQRVPGGRSGFCRYCRTPVGQECACCPMTRQGCVRPRIACDNRFQKCDRVPVRQGPVEDDHVQIGRVEDLLGLAQRLGVRQVRHLGLGPSDDLREFTVSSDVPLINSMQYAVFIQNLHFVCESTRAHSLLQPSRNVRLCAK